MEPLEPLEFINELTLLLKKNPPSSGLLGIHLINTHPQIHMMDAQFLQTFSTYSKEPWDAGTFSTKLFIMLNGVEIFTLTNLLPEEK